MILKFFIDGKSFECLKQTVAPGANYHSAIENAVYLSNIGVARVGSNAV